MLLKIAVSLLMFNYILIVIAYLLEKNWGGAIYWLGVIISVVALTVFGIKQM